MYHDKTEMFSDNSRKVQKIIVLHWTGSNTAKSAINWLNERKNGKGSVGYNYIIDRNGDMYILGDPGERWFHNTGIGTHFDKDTISIAFVSMGTEPVFTPEQIKTLKDWIEQLRADFDITQIRHHASLNLKKPDFPDHVWEGLKEALEL